MINTLIDYLKNKYDPVESIVLHGSRASGYNTNHSDWDFMVFTKHKVIQKQFRDELNGENIEFQVFQLPIEKKDIISQFGLKLKRAKVVYDVSNNGQNLINAAKCIYSKGLPTEKYSNAKRIGTKAYLNNAINGMKDNIDNPAMFHKKFGIFFPRIINVWYQFVDKTYSDNLYISIDYIKERDFDFFVELNNLYSFKTKPQEKICAAEKLVSHIFK